MRRGSGAKTTAGYAAQTGGGATTTGGGATNTGAGQPNDTPRSIHWVSTWLAPATNNAAATSNNFFIGFLLADNPARSLPALRDRWPQQAKVAIHPLG